MSKWTPDYFELYGWRWPIVIRNRDAKIKRYLINMKKRRTYGRIKWTPMQRRRGEIR